MSSQEFLPKAFSKSVSPPMSDSSDKEHPPPEDQAEAEESREDKANQNCREIPEDTAPVAGGGNQQHSSDARTTRVNSTGSSSTHSHSPKSSHESSEYSGSGSEEDQSYKVSSECTDKHKGKKKKNSGGHTLVPPGSGVEGTVQNYLVKELWYDWQHKSLELLDNDTFLDRGTFQINPKVKLQRDVKFLPLITEKNGDVMIKLLVKMAIEDVDFSKKSHEIVMNVTLYDSEQAKVISQRKKEKFKLAEKMLSGSFIVDLVDFETVRKIETETLRIIIDTRVDATDTSDHFVNVNSTN